MSAIAGVYHLDGRPVDGKRLEHMVQALAHRGPDGAATWSHGPIGLGHGMLWTTPESLQERLPLVNPGGDLAITADARIDNRDELIDRLGLAGHQPAEIADSQLILAAYEKWGESCPQHLIGDFAFSIWDGRQQSLFCARDHFGIRPFYYYRSERLFCFASEIKALFCLPEVPRKLDELRVGYHLTMTVEDNAVTFYQDVLRLPAAQSITVGGDGINLKTYWSLDPSRELHMESDQAYAEAFGDLFAEAVHCRLRSAFAVGSLLSGGLDSSAVTCVARELMARNGGQQLHTLSATYEQTPECDERSFIHFVLAQGDLKAHTLQMSQRSPLADWERVFWHGDEPFTSPTFYLAWGLCQAAQERGIRVLLDGVDGDTAVSHGDGMLAELARAGQWERFAAEAKAFAQHESLPSASQLFQEYGAPYLSELAQGWRWLALAREISQVSKHMELSRRRLLWHYGLKPVTPEPVRRAWRVLRGRNGSTEESNRIVRREFAQQISLDEHVEAAARHRSIVPKSAREEHYGILTSGVMPYAFELANRASAAFAVEARHPFSDRRLVEFCLALPAEQKLRQGWNRYIVRRALAGVLPEEIRWRGGKRLNCAAFTHGLLSHEKGLLDDVIMGDPGIVGRYVDVPVLQETWRRYLREQNLDDEMVVWHAVTLALWLRHVNLAP